MDTHQQKNIDAIVTRYQKKINILQQKQAGLIKEFIKKAEGEKQKLILKKTQTHE